MALSQDLVLASLCSACETAPLPWMSALADIGNRKVLAAKWQQALMVRELVLVLVWGLLSSARWKAEVCS